MSPRVAAAGLTDQGRQRRRNEDAFAIDLELAMAVVADGMGGHPAGDVASALAAAEVSRALTGHGLLPSAIPPAPGSSSPLGERMLEAVRLADRRIRSEGATDASRAGMGTTLTVLLVRPDERRWVIGHVGDSRAYVHGGGRLRQITRDDSWVQEQVDSGRLAAGEARLHPRAHVLTQAIGVGEAILPALVEGAIAPGEVYLLCTDGLTTMLPDLAIERILDDTLPDLAATAQALVDAANDRGGVDNVTVVLIRLED